MKRNVNATKRGSPNAPIPSTRAKELISKPQSRTPRLSQKIGAQSTIVSLNTASAIHDQDILVYSSRIMILMFLDIQKPMIRRILFKK